MAPHRARARYLDYCCDTPYRAILFQGGSQLPKMVRYAPLVVRLTQAHLCDTPFCNISRDNFRSGKTDPVQLKGVFNKEFLNRALFAYKNGHFASSFLLLGIGLVQASKKANLSFQSPSPKPLLNRTGSVFALPIIVRCPKTSTEAIATNIARYEKYRCWASVI